MSIEILDTPNGRFLFSPELLATFRWPLTGEDADAALAIARGEAPREPRLEDAVGDIRHLMDSAAAAADAANRIALEELDAPPPYPTSLELSIAHSCNLRCPYCFAGDGTFGRPGDMDRDTARAAVDFLLSGPSPRVSIAFLGGEPLCNREVVVDSMDYAARRADQAHKTVTFTITTNGTLLDPDLVSMFDKHRVRVLVSRDSADDDLNDRLRPSVTGRTRDQLQRGEALLWQRKYPAGNGVRLTITRDNCQFAQDVSSLVARGYRHVHALEVRSPDPEVRLGPVHVSQVREQFRVVAGLCQEALEAGRPFVFQPLMSWLGQVHRRQARLRNCAAAVQTIAVDPGGRLYPCVGLSGLVPPIGDLGRGIDEHARRPYLRRLWPQRDGPCKACWARNLCAGGCMQDALYRTGDLNGTDPAMCSMTRHRYRLGLELYAGVMTRVPEVAKFMASLGGDC